MKRRMIEKVIYILLATVIFAGSTFTAAAAAVDCSASSRIEGYVYHDANQNRIFDQAEQGVPNKTIRLTGFDTCTYKMTLRMLTTNASGYYSANVAQGSYFLAETEQNWNTGNQQNMDAWGPTTNTVAVVVIKPSEIKIINFGLRRI